MYELQHLNSEGTGIDEEDKSTADSIFVLMWGRTCEWQEPAFQR